MLPDFGRSEVEARLVAPVDAYYDALDAAAAQTGFFRGITSRLAVTSARSAVRVALTDLVQQATLVAAIQGNDGQPLTDDQQAAVMARIAEAESYLYGYLADLPTMTREQARARIKLYSAAIIQTESAVGALDKPLLPIYPGDSRLICSHKIPWCHCRLRWDKLSGNGNWNVTWLLDEAVENCASCRTLAADWNPLEIRNGQIVNNKRVAAFHRAYLAELLEGMS